MNSTVFSATFSVAENRRDAVANFIGLLPARNTALAPDLTDDEKWDFLKSAKIAKDAVWAIGTFEDKDINHPTFWDSLQGRENLYGGKEPRARVTIAGKRIINAYESIFKSTIAVDAESYKYLNDAYVFLRETADMLNDAKKNITVYRDIYKDKMDETTMQHFNDRFKEIDTGLEKVNSLHDKLGKRICPCVNN
jgi:hypothetical protein